VVKRVLFKCGKCGKVFSTYEELLRHHVREHSFVKFRILRKKKHRIFGDYAESVR